MAILFCFSLRRHVVHVHVASRSTGRTPTRQSSAPSGNGEKFAQFGALLVGPTDGVVAAALLARRRFRRLLRFQFDRITLVAITDLNFFFTLFISSLFMVYPAIRSAIDSKYFNSHQILSFNPRCGAFVDFCAASYNNLSTYFSPYHPRFCILHHVICNDTSISTNQNISLGRLVSVSVCLCRYGRRNNDEKNNDRRLFHSFSPLGK